MKGHAHAPTHEREDGPREAAPVTAQMTHSEALMSTKTARWLRKSRLRLRRSSASVRSSSSVVAMTGCWAAMWGGATLPKRVAACTGGAPRTAQEPIGAFSARPRRAARRPPLRSDQPRDAGLRFRSGAGHSHRGLGSTGRTLRTRRSLSLFGGYSARYGSGSSANASSARSMRCASGCISQTAKLIPLPATTSSRSGRLASFATDFGLAPRAASGARATAASPRRPPHR